VDAAPFFIRCGASLVKCPNCGTEFEFCSHCGTRLVAPVAEVPLPVTLEDRLRMRFEKREEAPPPELPVLPPVAPPLPPTPKEAVSPPTLTCSIHPGVAATTVCDLCGKPLCNECLTSYGELSLCKDDYRHILELQAPPAPLPPKLSYGAAAASATLILLSIIIARLNPWVASLIPSTGLSPLLGALSAVGILVGLFLRYARHEIAGALLIFLCSLISLIVGGGFFIGAVLGIIAGMIMLLGA